MSLASIGLVVLVQLTPTQPADPPPGGGRATVGEHGRPSEVLPRSASRIVRVDRVEIVGREQVSVRQIERELEREDLVAGVDLMVPEDDRVERARARLRATGYFRLVNIRFRVVPGTVDHVVLVVEVDERSSVRVTDVHLGSSRMTAFRGGLALAERNFLGRDVHLGGGLMWSTVPRIVRARRQQAYRLFAEAPRIGSAPFGILGSVYLISASEPYRVAGARDDPDPELFRTFDYNRMAGVVGVGFPVLPRLTLGVDYRFERVDAQLPHDAVYVSPEEDAIPVEFDVRDGIHRMTAAHFALVWDGREDAVLAGRGGRFELELQLSSAGIGSEYEYMKLVGGGAYTSRLPWRHWVTPSLAGGQITGDAPIYEQFYAGDLGDWTPGREEGLRFSTRNPIDVFGHGLDTRTFGALFGRADLEYVWPLFRRTRTRRVYGGDLFFSAGVFTVVGNAEDRTELDAAGERVVPLGLNANLGVRLDTALGTFDLSVGNVLRRTPL
jgi:outer membrane protein assembly factor BamA